MAVAYLDFLNAFPEFRDASRFPVETGEFWLSQAYVQLNAQRFGSSIDLAAMLYTAHNLAIAGLEIEAGGTGQGSALVTAEGVDKVSVSYDVASVSDQRGTVWNATSYGRRLFAMMKAYGAGPVYRLPR